MKKQMNKIKQCIILLFFSFIITSFFIVMDESQISFSHLAPVTMSYDNVVRTDYMDIKKTIKYAYDVGYATRIITKMESGQMERYYDEKGNPIGRWYTNNYSVFREYDDKGNNIRIKYYNKAGECAVNYDGYAVEERSYNGNSQLWKVRYLDAEGNPVCTPAFGYGREYEYDENGNESRIVYVDLNGNPMMTSRGYAMMVRTYYSPEGPEGRRAVKEFYFDEQGKPVSLASGEYGVYKEFDSNGQNSVLTYLNADGNPTASVMGYATVMYTYYANNSVATERYFDAEGKPFAVTDTSYGVKRENGRIIPLDADGRERFSVKNLLYRYPWISIIAALVIMAVSAISGKKGNTALLFLYLGAIAYMTLLNRENSGTGKEIGFLGEYRLLFTDGEVRADIIRNIWLFIPLGAILYRLYPKIWVLFLPVLLSATVEVIQHYTGIGFCEADDVISNGLGGAIGFGGEKLLADIREKVYADKVRKS